MPRSTYHHGDLRRALATAALEVVRSGGPTALTVREVARRLEVSPAAIYRHFADRDALMGEVARMARHDLAGWMMEEVERADHADPRARSVRRFLAVGRGYLGFAAAEPELLAAAFLASGTNDDLLEDPNPWNVLAGALDELVATGAMPRERRAGAETIAWSAVHGFASLRANHAFHTSAEPDPDAEALLAAIARSLDVVPEAVAGLGTSSD